MSDPNDDRMRLAEEIFAKYVLGLDLDDDKDLLWIAEEAFQSLAPDYEVAFGEEGEAKGIPYYCNHRDDSTSWSHPFEEKYKRIAEEELEKKHRLQQPSKRTSTTKKKATFNNLQEDDEKEDDLNGPHSRRGRERERERMDYEDTPSAHQSLRSIAQGHSTAGAGNSSSKRRASNTKDDYAVVEEVEDFDTFEHMEEKSYAKDHNTKQQQQQKQQQKPKDSSVEREKSKGLWSDFHETARDTRSGATTQGVDSHGYGYGKEITANNNNNNNNNNNTGNRFVAKDTVTSRAEERDRERDREESSRSRGRSVARESADERQDSYSPRDKARSPSHKDSSSHRETDHWDRDNERDWDRDRDRGSGRGREGDRERVLHGESTGRGTSQSRERDFDVSRSSHRPQDWDRSGPWTASASETVPSWDRDWHTAAERTAQTDALVTNERITRLTAERDALTKELNDLRASLSTQEQLVKDEQAKVIALEDQWKLKEREWHSTTQQEKDDFQNKQKRFTEDLENQWKERLRTMTAAHAEEVSHLQQLKQSLSMKLDEVSHECDALRRKGQHSKEEGRLESLTDLSAIRERLTLCEEELSLRTKELSTSRQETQTMRQQWQNATQEVQRLAGEAQHLDLTRQQEQQSRAVLEHSYNASAQRIAHLEKELSEAKAETLSLRKQREQLERELQSKTSQWSNMQEEQQQSQQDIRRMKSVQQQDVARLQAKLVEVDALVAAQRAELDRVMTTEAQASKQARAKLDASEQERSLLQERLLRSNLAEETLRSQCTDLQRQVLLMQEESYALQRTVKDEQQRSQSTNAVIQEIRKGHEQEKDALQSQLSALQQELSSKQRLFECERQQMMTDFEERVPQMIKKALSAKEKEHMRQLESERDEWSQSHQRELSRVSREMISVKQFYEEQEARRALLLTDEKVELDSLRMKSKTLTTKCHRLEERLEDVERHNRQLERACQRDGSSVLMITSDGERSTVFPSQPQQSQGQRFSDENRAPNQADRLNDNNLYGDRQSMKYATSSTGASPPQPRPLSQPQHSAPLPPPPPQYQSQPHSQQMAAYRPPMSAPATTFDSSSILDDSQLSQVHSELQRLSQTLSRINSQPAPTYSALAPHAAYLDVSIDDGKNAIGSSTTYSMPKKMSSTAYTTAEGVNTSTLGKQVSFQDDVSTSRLSGFGGGDQDYNASLNMSREVLDELPMRSMSTQAFLPGVWHARYGSQIGPYDL